jgi:hypothetical protein
MRGEVVLTFQKIFAGHVVIVVVHITTRLTRSKLLESYSPYRIRFEKQHHAGYQGRD